MKLQTKAQHLRRYAKRSNHYQQNKLFDEDTKRFYHQINNQKADVQEPPLASKQNIFGVESLKMQSLTVIEQTG
jgi:hypothetical protein